LGLLQQQVDTGLPLTMAMFWAVAASGSNRAVATATADRRAAKVMRIMDGRAFQGVRVSTSRGRVALGDIDG
jgi:hypothetical protein